jgi:DNA-binding FadR family transcriptional regulator
MPSGIPIRMARHAGGQGSKRATAGLSRRIATTGPGDALPTISALAWEYDVSDPTLRRAMEGLRALRLVRRPSGVAVAGRSRGGPVHQTSLDRATLQLRAEIAGLRPGDVFRSLSVLEVEY